MSILRRVLLVAAIAALAVVPLRAFGVVGSGAPSGLSVSASLGGCGVAGDGIVCQIDVSFTGVEDADYYTASVTRADVAEVHYRPVGARDARGVAGGARDLVPARREPADDRPPGGPARIE